MRSMTVCVVLLGVMLLAGPAMAADVDGKWTGTVVTDMGEIPVQFEFKADGATLSGTTMGFDGSTVQIKNGKVDGANISFTVTFDFGGMPLDINYKGIVTASEIKVTADAMGMPIEFVMKKG